MTHRLQRQGKTWRGLLFLLVLIGVLPVLMFGMYTVRGRAADNDNRLAQPHPYRSTIGRPLQSQQVLRLPSTPQPSPSPQQPNQTSRSEPAPWRAVYETEFREETVVTKVPEVDPKTGETVIREHQQVVRYPVTNQRFERNYTSKPVAAHSPKAMRLAAELRELKEDDESRDKKLEQLRDELEQEFTRLHEQQLAEIERTEQRLQSLKSLHDKRQENKRSIVNRRIDELLGKADPLSWNPTPILPMPIHSQQLPGQPSGLNQSIQIQQHRSINQSPTRRGHPASGGQPQSQPGYSHSAPIGLPGPPHIPYSQPSPGSQSPARVARTGGQPPAAQELSTSSGKNSPGSGAPALPEAADKGDLESAGYQPAAAPARRQVGVPRSALGEVFYLARNAADANAELAAAEIEYQQFKKLREKRAISDLEFQRAELKLEKSKRDVKLVQMQMKALSESMERARELAKSMLERASVKLSMTEAGYRNGIHTDQELADARFAVKEAKIAMIDADEIVEKLKETMATVQGFDDQGNSGEPNEESSQATTAPSNSTTDPPTEHGVEEL